MLVANGLRVIRCLEGRSERTRGLAEKAGIAAVNPYAEMVCEAQMVISIMVPAEVKQAVTRVAEALKKTGEQIVYVDCNAIVPETAKRVALVVEATGSRTEDAGIIGGPPGSADSSTRILYFWYACGGVYAAK